MPGTCGTFVALMVIAFLPDPWYAPTTLALAVAATLFGPGLADRMISSSGLKDPQKFVLDEGAGIWIACLRFENPGWVGLLAAFFFFRLFDMTKPGPVRKLEQLPGGRGVVYDDVAAGLIALPLSILVQYLAK